MNKKQKQVLLLSLAVVLLSACGQKEGNTSQSTPSSSTSEAEESPRFKTTEKFGSVSNIILNPVFELPSKYNSYTRQEVSEATKEEISILKPAVFESYINTWIKQAASIENPNWQMVAGILHPEKSEEKNEFKKQKLSEKAQTEVTPDKEALNVVYGWQGSVLNVDGPDAKTGEYYISINPNHRFEIVSYVNSDNQRLSLYYSPDFKAIGLNGDNSGNIQLTVKVPLEKAKEIETLREDKNPTMLRVYGHVTGMSTGMAPQVYKNGATAALNLEVEAIELGIRKDGEFESFFFLDSDQLKRAK